MNDRARQRNTLLRCPSDVLNIPNPHKGNSEGELKHGSDSGDDPGRVDECRCSTRQPKTRSQRGTAHTLPTRWWQTRTSNPNTRFDGSTQTRLHAVAASCGDLTVVVGAPAERTPRCAFQQLPG